MRRLIRGLLAFVLGLTAIASAAGEGSEDHRAWQHGVDLVRVADRLLVVWGSPGNPPRANPGGDWQHDIYYAWLNPAELDSAAMPDTVTVVPRLLVSRPEAQEPPSVAINSKGTILVTSEDGYGGINQNAGLWDSALKVRRRYPFMIRRGGHSGHVAAMGDRFLVVYGEGWVEGGGWRDLGTGKNVLARVVGNNGRLGREIRLDPDRTSRLRDGWPLVAGSDRNWLVVWQRYADRTLQAALVDAAGAVSARRQVIDGLPLRYAYDVQFAPQLASYVVAGSSGEGGFVSLISMAGDVVRTQRGLPPMASESRIILGRDGARTIAVYPVAPHGIAVVRLSGETIELAQVVDHPYTWDYSGTTGAFVAPGRLLFATLSTAGLRLIPVALQN